MKIGSKIRRLRKLRGLTIEELAVNADLTKGFISQLERDLAVPSVTTLKQLLDVLGVQLSVFFNDFSEREKNIFIKKERTLDNENKSYKTERLIPKLKYLEMEPVMLTLQPKAELKKPFEDDEGFG
ncbi:MAG: helix-turn-helix transcriptional regulator, partial [Calditrichia bacterium]